MKNPNLNQLGFFFIPKNLLSLSDESVFTHIRAILKDWSPV
jgi:hypothetical protein